MTASAEAPGASPRVVEAPDLSALLDALLSSGYRVLGPTVKDGVIVLDELASVAALPAGVGEEHGKGRYRLRARGDAALFGYTVGPHAWKRFLFPASLRLFSVSRDLSPQGADAVDERPLALFGVRPCDVAAIARQDRVFLGGAYQDPAYRERRESAVVVAVACTESDDTCFCASLGTGPRASAGFDLALTELAARDRHAFLVEIGSPRGAALLAGVPSRPAGEGDLAAARAAVRAAASAMTRTVDAPAFARALGEEGESPRWEAIAERCLSCANCTMVCPTCFCTTVEDASGLSGASASRWRRWDSCHTLDFSYIHGGSIRRSAASRYRQWITHKLATWTEQFGATGCVGCGRCITWCPVGIDLTEEARAVADARPSPVA